MNINRITVPETETLSDEALFGGSTPKCRKNAERRSTDLELVPIEFVHRSSR